MPNDVINQITIKGTTYDINGGGHVIEDSDGTDMTQRSNLQFLDAGVSDDSTNNRTKIENVRVIDDEDELDDAPDGMYMGSYDDADIVTDASNIGYDNTESGLESNNVQSAIDEVVNDLSSKVDKIDGKGLSTNDYTTAEKTKLSGISTGANKTEASTTNGNIKIDGVETQVYDDSEIQDKIDTTTTSISGNPISISGLKSNQLAINPIITFEPIQAGSGTPSPSNIRAISGYDKIEVLSCGVNVWDEVPKMGYSIDGTTGQDYVVPNSWCFKNYIHLIPNTNYFLKSPSYLNARWYDENKNYLGYSIIQADTVFNSTSVFSNARYLRFNGYGLSYNNNISINYPATQTSYVASINPTSISESLGQTVYGATWYPRTGKLSNTHKAVDMGSLSWTYYSSSTRPFFYTILSDASGNATPNNSWCEIYPIVTDVFDKSMYWNGTQIRVFDYSYTDATAFTNAVSGKKLVYPLAAPTEIQLTPHEISLLKDFAYISTNGTSIALDYHNGELASLSDVAQVGETVNEILNQTSQIKIVNIPYSAFTWDSTQKYFVCTSVLIDITKLLGFMVYATNGMAIMSAYAPYTNRIVVAGFIPKTGGSIDNTYEFVCNVVYKV